MMIVISSVLGFKAFLTGFLLQVHLCQLYRDYVRLADPVPQSCALGREARH